jgi:adenine-specific DNA-methyltransferase
MVRNEGTLQELYCADQLIPYLGNKRKLLPFLGEAIGKTGIRKGSFLDLFAGSGVVARLAKTLGYRVIANDWEPYSYYINRCYIGNNREPDFSALGGIKSVFKSLNEAESQRGYIATHYCPKDTENPDLDDERLFFNQENGRKIDAIRELIEEWRTTGRIDETEFFVLISALLYQVSYRSNTSGVFKGFHRGFGGATKTALYRIMTPLVMEIPRFWDNRKNNRVLMGDAAKIVEKENANIVYIDPPYNQHQYGANYHLLNTVALWDKPPINERIYVNGRPVKKAAIREDWRTERRSPYCYKDSALPAFANLINKTKADWIIVSYSTDGIIPVEEMARVLNERGELTLMGKRYKRYRVSSQRPSPQGYNAEMAFIVDTGVKGTKNGLKNAIDTIKRLRTDQLSENQI